MRSLYRSVVFFGFFQIAISPLLTAAEPPVNPYDATDLTAKAPSDSTKHINAELASITSIELVDTPLREVVDYLKDIHKIDIRLDEPALTEAKVDHDTPITLWIKGVSLRSALHLILDELHLKYCIHNESLLITSAARANGKALFETKVYSVADLVRPVRGDNSQVPDFESLMSVIRDTIAPKTWETGNLGTIRQLPGSEAIVVNQSTEAHEEISALLEGLRNARKGGKSPNENIKRIRAELDSPTDVEFAETPVKEVVEYLKDVHKIEIEFDFATLKASVEPEAFVTLTLHRVPLRSALDRILGDLKLTYCIRNEVLFITTPSRAASDDFVETRVYPVSDLAERSQTPLGGVPSNGVIDIKPIIGEICRSVDPKTWKAQGGAAGAIYEYTNSLAVVVRQNPEVQEHVASFLDKLRKARKTEAHSAARERGPFPQETGHR